MFVGMKGKQKFDTLLLAVSNATSSFESHLAFLNGVKLPSTLPLEIPLLPTILVQECSP